MENWKVSITTFNCGKALPYDDVEALESIIERLIPKKNCNDVYVLGFQELAEIWKGSFKDEIQFILNKIGNCAETLITTLFNVEFEFVASNFVGTIGEVIIIKKSLSVGQKISIECKRGMFGSSLKGAAALCLDIEYNGVQDAFIFIVCHLAANEGKFNERIDDYNNILSECDQAFRMRTLENSHVFFFGDLNFRVQKPIYSYPSQEIVAKSLKHYEELNILRNEDVVFKGFTEAPINFPPTYKYRLNPLNEYTQKRIPSWCDRIFYKDYQKSIHATYTAVTRDSVLAFTDHQPVNLSIQVPHDATAGPILVRKQYGTQLPIYIYSDIIIGYGAWMKATHPYASALFLFILIIGLGKLIF